MRELQANPVIFDSNLKGFETAILFSENRPPIVGTKATETYGCMTKEMRRKSQLKVHFKPEIEESEEAQRLAIEFLKGILDLNNIYNRDLIKRGHTFIFGVPSQASDKYCQALKDIAYQVGFPAIDIIEEPIGALIYHLSKNNLSAYDARKGVLVVDFGGGTCDFALMEDLQVKHSWGSMSLGGRLFDDLFYQIFLSQDQNHKKKIDEEEGEFYVHWYLCREVKEKFSQYMRMDRSETFHYPLTNYGQIRDLTWGRFLEWAKYYIPSQELREYFVNNKVSDPRLTSGGAIDLIAWFKEELMYGLQKASNKNPGHVILTGGSSLWPFVQDIVQDLLNVEKESIYCGDNPYAVISMGLSLYPALAHRYREAKINIQNAYPTFLEEEIQGDLLRSMIERLTNNLTTTFSSLLFDEKLLPLIESFKTTGGRFEDLEEMIHEAIYEFEEEAKVITEDMIYEEIEDLPYKIVKKMMELFAREGLYYSYEEKMDLRIPVIEIEGVTINTTELLSILRKVLVPVVGILVAEVCGGAGLALIASGPVGWVIGGLLGVTGAYIGGKKAEIYIKSIALPSYVTKILISKGSIQRLIEKAKKGFEKRMRKHLKKEMKEMEVKIVRDLDPALHNELEALSLIASLKR